MSWSTAVDRIPHVYEHIFDYLDVCDGLAAAEACPNWESTIFTSIRSHLALKIFRDPQDWKHLSLLDMLAVLGISVSRDQQKITVEEVNRSCRRFDSVIVSSGSGPNQNLVWDELICILKSLNRRQPIRWARIDGTNGDADQLTKPDALMEMGRIFTKLQHLELVLPRTSVFQNDWHVVFQEFTLLESLILHNGHVQAMYSVLKNCSRLKKVELFKFSLPDPKCVLIFVPHVNKLIVDGQVIIDRHSQIGVSG